MCGRYTLASTDALIERFGLTEFHETRIPPRFNIAPSQDLLTVRQSDNGPRAGLMRWGFQPAWMASRKGPPLINAKAETLVERPLWRGVLRQNRCLIPADGFYEWRVVPGTKSKQPMHVRLKEGGLFAFAGLYVPDEEGNQTCAIVTTAANALVAAFHTRMPAILDPEDEALWLDPSVTDSVEALACLRSYPPELMEAYPVSPSVGNVRNDRPDLIGPLSAS